MSASKATFPTEYTKRKDERGDVVIWNPKDATLRIPLLEASYLEREEVAKSVLFALKGKLP